MGKGNWDVGSLDNLAQQTAYHDLTGAVLQMIRYDKGLSTDGVHPTLKPVPPNRAQLAEVTAKLRQDPTYNAPGRDDPVGPVAIEISRKIMLPLRIAAFPVLRPGEPFVDYAPALAAAFPNETVLVAHGRWISVAGPEKETLESARNYAYGAFGGSFSKGSRMENRIGSILTRVNELRTRKPFGRPQPPPQPKPVPFDARRTIAEFAPWTLLGSAAVLGGAGLMGWRLRTAKRDEYAAGALRRNSASAFAKIGELGAKLYDSDSVDPDLRAAAAERHATARDLFDQAHTGEAMTEVRKIAVEGIDLLRRNS